MKQIGVPMPRVPRPSTDAVLLTEQGRRRLEDRLVQATESLREMAERLGERDGVPTGEYRRTLAQVAELRGLLERARSPAEVPDDPRIVELGDEVEVEAPAGPYRGVTEDAAGRPSVGSHDQRRPSSPGG